MASSSPLWSLTMLALILHDLGWILRMPALSLPACLIGIILLAWITIKECFMGPRFELAVACTAFSWLLGNLFWTFSELMWEEDKPAGFLAHIKALHNLDSHYEALMWLATVTMVITLFLFVLFALLGNACLTEARDVTPGSLVCNRLPIGIYKELSLVPWIVMDFGWSTANLMQRIEVVSETEMRALLCVCSIGGVVAVVLEIDCARREWTAGRRCSALMFLVEMMWVLGNMVWMSEDVVTGHGEEEFLPAYWAAVILFGIGAVLSLPTVFLIEEDNDSGVASIDHLLQQLLENDELAAIRRSVAKEEIYTNM